MGTDSSSTTKVVLDLDNSEFIGKLRESLGMLGALGEVESLEKLGEKFMKIGALVGVATAAVMAVKIALDLTQEAEKLAFIEKSFKSIAESAGLSADIIKNDLIRAVGGLAAESDVLKSASKAMIALGENAKRMPEIMEIARRATKLFGGDLLENFENMSRALAAGNVRMLRQYGLIIDVTKAKRDYAKALGIGVEYLTETGNRQAIMNAAIEQGTEKFKDISISTDTTTGSIAKLGVAFKEMGEVAVVAWGKTVGPAVTSMVSDFSGLMSKWATSIKALFGDQDAKAKRATDSLLEHKAAWEKTIAIMQGPAPMQSAFFQQGGTLKEATAELERINDLLKEKNKINERSSELEMHRAQMSGVVGGGEKGGESSSINTEKLKADKLKFENDILKLRQDRIRAEETVATSAVALSKLHDEEVVAAHQQSNIKIKGLDDDLNIKRIINESQHADAVKQIQRKLDADLKQIQMKRDQDEINALKNLEKQNAYTAAGFRAAWAKNSAQAANDLKNFSKLGNTTFNAIGSNAVAAFTAMGDGSKSAGEAMKGFLFGTIGDVAIAQGTMHLLAGIWPPNPIELAEGAALIALGGALKSVGSSSGASAPSVSGSAASGGSGSIGQEPAKPSAPTPSASPTKHVAINIHGHLFETDQTRNRLMEMIREAGDYTDFNLKQVGQP